jgi:hypothetical protein
MKLGPKQIRFIRPFWPALSGRTLRFAGRRNTIHLQETALVVEGEILRFHYLGIERLIARALSEWTMVTVPYSRIRSVWYRSNRWLRLVIIVVAATLSIFAMRLPWTPPSEWTALDAVSDALVLVPVLVLAGLVWWGVRASYVLVFRSKDGTRVRLCFRIRSKVQRLAFESVLRSYREASRAYTRSGVTG